MEQSISSVFSQKVAQYPEHTAIRTLERSVTYAELDVLVNQVAASLKSISADSDTVGLLMETSIEICACVLGVLRAGGSYVVLDPDYPPARLQYIARNSNLGAVISNNYSIENVAEGLECQQLTWDEISRAEQRPVSNAEVDPASRAVVMYTSGSTGTPKGVVHSHRNVLFEIWNLTTYWNITSDDKVLLYHSLSFANSVRTFYIALLNGGCLLPFDLKKHSFKVLGEWMFQQSATILRSTPTTFRRFYQAAGLDLRLPSLRVLSLGGEALSTDDYEVFNTWADPGAVLIHGFGPSEAFTSIWHIIPRDTPLPTGKVLCGSQTVPGKTVKVVDENLDELGPEEVGQIAVLSDYVALKYENNPEQTRASFIENWSDSGSRLYLTGDMGKFHHNGMLEHVGRTDFQIKLRGYRVDLAEIEFALKSHPQVINALVIGADRANFEKRLVAYVLAQEARPKVSSLREHVERLLPFFMVPHHYIFISQLPLTPTGKADRLALPEPDNKRPELDVKWVGVHNLTERRIVQIWEEILDYEGIGVDDDFFHLGGTSLDSVVLVDRLSAVTGKTCDLSHLYKYRTPRQMSKFLESNDSESDPVFVDTYSAQGGPVLLWLVGGSGDMRSMVIQKLVDGLHNPITTRTFLPASLCIPGEIIDIETLSVRLADAIGTMIPNREFLLGGDCTGAILAWQTCIELQKRELYPDRLILIDLPRGSESRLRKLDQRRQDQMTKIKRRHRSHVAAIIRNAIDELSRASPGEIVGIVKRKAKTLLTRGVADAGLKARSRRSDWIAGYAKAFNSYEPGECDVDVSMLVTDGMYDEQVISGWEQRVGGVFELERMPGDHHGYHDEYVHVTTRWLGNQLDHYTR